MKVTKLQLKQFRNIRNMELIAGEGPNIIYGDNAQGKTNLLEAIWLFSGARSFRGSRDREFIRFEEETARLNLEFFADRREQEAELVYGREKKKVSLNGIGQDSATALAGSFCAVVFSPDQLSMVKGAPEGRRKFMDTSLAQVYPRYRKVLESYERILRQRAHLLKDSRQQPSLLDTLEVWDHHLARYGGYIIATRMRYLRRLEEAAGGIYHGISRGTEEFSLTYRSTVPGTGDATGEKEACAEALLLALRENRQEDMLAGATTAGPHRDDILIEISGRNARSFASQGQQRSCVLALKLAECELMGRTLGEPPVVLLDDVMSELDEGRRNYLLNHLDGKQVWITCCDRSAFRTLEEGAVFQISEGALVQES